MGDAAAAAKLHYYYTRVVRELMPGIVTDCDKRDKIMPLGLLSEPPLVFDQHPDSKNRFQGGRNVLGMLSVVSVNQIIGCKSMPN